MNDKFENFNMINVKFHKEGLKMFLNISLLYWRFRHSLPFKLWLVLGVLFDRIIASLTSFKRKNKMFILLLVFEKCETYENIYFSYSVI